MVLREAPQHEGTQVAIKSENSRKVEEQRESHFWGNTHAQETRTTLQEFKAVCAQSESASETGFAIRGRGKKMAQNERLPTFHPETKIRERGRGGGKVFLRFTIFPISGSCRKQRLGPEPPNHPDHPGSHSHLLSAAPAPQKAFAGGGRDELGLRPG